jgi:peptidyl-prolyl cis-trans isomerase A (cyclophilin A)
MNKNIIVIMMVIMLFAFTSIITGCSNRNSIITGNLVEDKMATNRHAIIDTTMGTIEVELFEDKAPITTKNFIDLSEKGFYNNVTFHRVIPNFMVQTGDPRGDGTGGPGYTIKDEFGPGLKFNQSGILAMANSGPNTGGSQFFITTVATPWLDGKHAIFGQVVKGMNVVNNISMVQRDKNDRPLKPILIKSVKIV